MRAEVSGRPAPWRADEAEARARLDRGGGAPGASASFLAGHGRFVQRRRALLGEGASPRVASALANLGVETLAALADETWEGPDGLAVRLARQRWIGEGLIRAVKAQFDAIRAA